MLYYLQLTPVVLSSGLILILNLSSENTPSQLNELMSLLKEEEQHEAGMKAEAPAQTRNQRKQVIVVLIVISLLDIHCEYILVP